MSSAATQAGSKLFARARYSGLQRQVMDLYRQFLRAAEKKGTVEEVTELKEMIRFEFKSKLNIPTRDFRSIEYHLRMGRQQLETLNSEHVEKVSFVSVKRTEAPKWEKKLTPITAYNVL